RLELKDQLIHAQACPGGEHPAGQKDKDQAGEKKIPAAMAHPVFDLVPFLFLFFIYIPNRVVIADKLLLTKKAHNIKASFP
ncbi:MAG: hypothetical protein J6D46_06765, partial [Lachnospiraceae bacterium]|nr:hypothetical protein [Lachnospiraceae bacterium]